VSDEKFVHRAYRRLPEREPDEKGFLGYVGGLMSGSIGRAEAIHRREIELPW
jgi:hypothetical protein